MSERVICEGCGEEHEEAALAPRPLVPRRLLESGTFDIDPLGTAGAQARLCAACADALDAPMLLAEDLAEFAKAVALHRELHAPAPGRESQAARARLVHRALHLGLRALTAELAERPVVIPARPEPDQLGLFVSKGARLAKVEAALAEGNLAAAKSHADEVVRHYDLPEARYLASRLPAVMATVQACSGRAGELALLAQRPEELLERSRVKAPLMGALARGLHRLVAQAAETERAGAAVNGRPAGWHWWKAGDKERAAASLAASVQAAIEPARALALLGDLAFEAGDVGAAREHYRRAACADPGRVDWSEALDGALTDLLAAAEELEVQPEEVWLPLLGYAEGVFRLPGQPEGQGPCREFHQALLDARRTADPGPRRRMKELAPRLFERLRDEGKL